MRELSLFTGAGGGVLGSKILGWQTVGYVEWDEYPQKVIAQRIKDGIFDEAPIFTDVREFAQSGAARQYRGFVDVVTGGFPCQPFSVAGKRKASDDERNMWPATLDVIKAVKPPIVYLENVPGLLSATVDDGSGRSVHYFGTVLRDLAESGYRVGWCVLGADDVGAPHCRKRLWIIGLANTNSNGRNTPSEGQGRSERETQRSTSPLGDQRSSIGREPNPAPRRTQSSRYVEQCGEARNVANTERERLEGDKPKPTAEGHTRLCGRAWSNQKQNVFEYRPEESGWWSSEPELGRVANGVADRTNRLKAIGNGQVPITMACAYEILFQTVGG